MTTVDITHKRGDSRAEAFQITDDATPAVAIPLTGAVIRVAVKEEADDPNDFVLILKTSYRSTEVEITDSANGRFVWKLEKEDTVDLDADCYVWDVEVVKPGAARAGAIAGTFAVTNGSKTVTGTGTDFTKLKRGDIVTPAGAVAANQKNVVVTKVVDATHFETDYVDWATAAGIAFTAFIGDVMTPGGGEFSVSADVTH